LVTLRVKLNVGLKHKIVSGKVSRHQKEETKLMGKLIQFFVISLVSLVILMMIGVWLFPGQAFNLAKKIEWARSGLKEKTINVNGLHISYLSGGKGDPLLLLHGFAGGKEHWVWLTKYLGESFSIIAPDVKIQRE